MSLDERAFFTDRPETPPGALPMSPNVIGAGEYSIRWVRALEERPLAAKSRRCRPGEVRQARDYLLRLDDEVTCKACGKKFEIPSQHSLLFVNQLAGLPNDEELER